MSSPATPSRRGQTLQKPLLQAAHHAGRPSQRFQQVVRELLKFKAQGQLDDEQLESLISYACSLLIEQEVERRVNDVLNDALIEKFITDRPLVRSIKTRLWPTHPLSKSNK